MTACVETQKKNLEGGALSNKIIRAILAIVLVIGLAPTLNVGTAYAATDQEAWDAATFTYNVAPDAKGEFHFAETTAPVEFALNSVALVDGTAVAATDYKVAYYTDDKGTETTIAGSGAAAVGAAPVKAGTYYIGTTKGAAVHYQKFAIDAPAKKSLATAVPYLVVADETDVSNVPVYNGATFTIGKAEGNINFAIDGKPLVPTTYYTVTGAVGADAKTYKITLTGTKDYLGSTKYADVVVAPLDLSKTLVSFADQEWTGSAITDQGLTINGKTATSLAADLEVAIIAYTGINASGIPDTVTALGHYTQSVAPKAGNTNVIGKASAEFNVVTAIAAPGDFKYANSDGKVTEFSALTNLIFNASDAKDNTFVPANVSVAGLDAAKGEFTVVVTDKDGKVVTDWTAPGKYVATVQVTIDGATYALGGKNTLPFTVIKGTIENATVFVSLDGKNIDPLVTATKPLEVTYTGKAFVPTVVIKDAAGKALVAGTDYMVAYKDSKSAVVTEIVAPDTYTIALTSDAYTLPAAAATGYRVTVNPLTITGYQIAQTKFDSTTTGIAATGEAIVPVVQYKTAATDPVTGEPIWTTLDASLYTITYVVNDTTKAPVAAADLKAAGEYTATIALTKDAATLYAAPTTKTADFNIFAKIGFTDVSASAWYAASVSKAAELKYMGGIGGKLFAPDASITRGEVACVVANMAGDHPHSEVNPFTDVHLGAFYGYEVCWAKQAGIMNGYMGTTLFGPYDQITREQFACTLYNYAKAYDKDITVDTKAELAKFPDSAQVSDFAQTAVAWAAKNKIMGNAGVLNPAAQVTRAEVAAMAVNFQPEKMK